MTIGEGRHGHERGRRRSRLSGGLNAGTPFETASTPVMAVQPFENAVSSRKVVSSPACPVPSGARGGTGTMPPVAARHAPTAMQREDADDEEIGRHGKDAARFADAAQIAEHQDRDEREEELHPADVEIRERRRERGDAGRDADGDREDVVDAGALPARRDSAAARGSPSRRCTRRLRSDRRGSSGGMRTPRPQECRRSPRRSASQATGWPRRR